MNRDAATIRTMSKNRPNQYQTPADRETPGTPRGRPGRHPGQLPFVVRAVVSLLLVWHITAVFMAPMSIAVVMSEPTSVSDPARVEVPLPVQIAQKRMQWYLDALYLNHGYHFFAPNPGAGHLIRYWVFDARGNELRTGEFPNSKEYWPRLLYHRYFMLADQCEGPTPVESEQTRWKQTYLTAYARELLRQYGGESVRVQRIIHYPLFRDDALEGRSLTYPETYRMDLEVVQRRQDLDLPAPNQSSHWNQLRRDVASGWQGGVR
jgi:hypothetical protein